MGVGLGVGCPNTCGIVGVGAGAAKARLDPLAKLGARPSDTNITATNTRLELRNIAPHNRSRPIHGDPPLWVLTRPTTCQEKDRLRRIRTRAASRETPLRGEIRIREPLPSLNYLRVVGRRKYGVDSRLLLGRKLNRYLTVSLAIGAGGGPVHLPVTSVICGITPEQATELGACTLIEESIRQFHL